MCETLWPYSPVAAAPGRWQKHSVSTPLSLTPVWSHFLRGKPGTPLAATGNLRRLGDQPIQVCISHLLEKARFCPDRAQGRSRPPALYRSRLEQEAEAPPKRRTSSFCADRERHWARFLSLRPTVSSIFCEARSWWLSVGALRNTSRHVDTLSVCVIEFNGWARAHPDTTRTPSVH